MNKIISGKAFREALSGVDVEVIRKIYMEEFIYQDPDLLKQAETATKGFMLQDMEELREFALETADTEATELRWANKMIKKYSK